MLCEHALTEFCSCLERRAPAYVAPHVEMRGPGERLPQWACVCTDPWTGKRLRKARRHICEADCVPQEDVDAFKAQHGLKDNGLARSLMFLETFNPLHPQDWR